MPKLSWSGVRLDAASGVCVGRKKRVAFSNRERDPYGLMPAPSARGSTGGGAAGVFDLHAATAAVTAPPMARNQRRDRGSFMVGTIIPAACASRIATRVHDSARSPCPLASRRKYMYDTYLN